MLGYIVTLENGNLKVSLKLKDGLRTISNDLSSDIANESSIVNEALFARELKGLMSQLGGSKDPINFLLEPQDVYLAFLTVRKNNGDLQEQIIAEARQKLQDVLIEDLYFSYQKIAPFVYQFVGIKKETLAKYINISNELKVGIRILAPWVLLLPKFLGKSEPCIFVLKRDGKQVVALSEMNGVYFTASYDQDKSLDELQELVKQLSVYKRHQPINKVFSLNYETFSLDPKYEVMNLDIPGVDMEQVKGFELHLVLDYLYDKNPSTFDTQINLLNLVSAPAKSRSKSPVLYVAGSLVATALIIGIFLGVSSMGGDSSTDEGTELALGVAESNVLSENSENNNSSQEAQDNQENNIQDEEVEVELNKSDLNIRVENGAGVAGIAAQTQTVLENLGYTVVEIGNAEEVGRETTLLRFKTAKLQYRDLLVTDLKDNYELELEEGLDDDFEYDVLMIVGQN